MKRAFITIGTIVLLLRISSLQCITGDDEVLACKKKNGIIRIVDDHSKCRKQEDPIFLCIKGDPGSNCQDLNGDHFCNLETEDIDGNGVCDALDCQGPSGDQGDTGERGEQGPSGAALYVVDADGKEVGLLIEFGTGRYVVFYEPLNLILTFPPHSGTPCQSELKGPVYFDTDDCDCSNRIYFDTGNPWNPLI